MIKNLKLLKVGDTIGIYSPSAPATYTAPNRTQRAISFLESKNIKIKMGKLTSKKDYYRSGSIKERSEELLGNEEMPFLSDFDSCHTHPMMPLVIGEIYELDATNKIVTWIINSNDLENN